MKNVKTAKPAANVGALVQSAVALQQSGRLTEAAAQFKTLLKFFPDHPQILAALGTIALQQHDLTGGVRWLGKSLQVAPNQTVVLTNRAVGLYLLKRFDEALAGFERAIDLKPDYPDAYSNRGNVLKELGRLQDALASYERAIALKPEYADAHNNRGTVLQELGRLDEAVRSYDRAIALRPDYAEAHSNRGNALKLLKRPDEALASYRRATELRPDYAEAHNNLGAVLQGLGRFDEALEAYNRAVALKPEYAEASSNRGVVLEELDRSTEALASYERAVAHRPDYAEAHNNRGAVLRELGRLGEALAAYDQAIALKPTYAEAHSNRGVVLEELKRFDEALAAYERAIALKPDYAQAYNNRAAFWQKRLKLPQALADYQRAFALKPDYVEALTNSGGALQEMRRIEEALETYRRAIALRAEYAPAHMGMAFVHILRGEYLGGWAAYEWRWRDQLKGHARSFNQPQWSGDQPIAGKTLLIHAEQGFGDSIQCCRYAPMARALGARVVLEVPSPLISLLSTLDADCVVVEKGTALPAFDLHCPIMSLPLAFKTTVATIPSTVPYLHADPPKRTQWQQQLGEKTRPRVGLAWSGAIKHKNDHNRSLALRQLEPLFQLPLDFHSLQAEVRPDDAATLLQARVLTHMDRLNDFSDTAALVKEMDLVISVDTSVAHLAGALGKPVWILLPFMPDYRWMLDRQDCPWYPTATLFRQCSTGDWPAVIAEVSRRLRESFGGTPSHLTESGQLVRDALDYGGPVSAPVLAEKAG